MGIGNGSDLARLTEVNAVYGRRLLEFCRVAAAISGDSSGMSPNLRTGVLALRAADVEPPDPIAAARVVGVVGVVHLDAATGSTTAHVPQLVGPHGALVGRL